MPIENRRQLDLVQAMNRDHNNSWGDDSFLDGRIKAMEAAYRVQFEAMDAFDVRKESQAIRTSMVRAAGATLACLRGG